MKYFITLILYAFAFPAIAQPARVIDGDTLEVDGATYRLNAIDAPEHGQKCGKWACGKDATEALARLIEGQQIECKPITQDNYGRTIATCYVGDQDLGREMVRSGHAWAFTRFSDIYLPEQDAAKQERRGVWSGDFQTSWDFRAQRWANASQIAPDGCPIKGNISKNGRIYHPPWSTWYSRTKINTAKGERWFCDEAEAVAAGWRAPAWR